MHRCDGIRRQTTIPTRIFQRWLTRFDEPKCDCYCQTQYTKLFSSFYLFCLYIFLCFPSELVLTHKHNIHTTIVCEQYIGRALITSTFLEISQVLWRGLRHLCFVLYIYTHLITTIDDIVNFRFIFTIFIVGQTFSWKQQLWSSSKVCLKMYKYSNRLNWSTRSTPIKSVELSNFSAHHLIHDTAKNALKIEK